MALALEPYRSIVVETYRVGSTAGRHGDVHVGPIAEEGFPPGIHVECPRSIVRNHPVGTRFRIRAKLTDRLGGAQYLYSHHSWKYEVLTP